ncbi:hypothetical protein [Syntrophorhabdus aromaticivorans]|uniref:hypothetical protein n=1 Tax=Syntrophorhabdus aromaticivorans TaxID=328301 RepID=UPI0003F5D2F8|nr:hypothetical protein [Syntrophorhabdus aromaticivorans]
MLVLAIAIDRAMAFTPWLLRRGRARRTGKKGGTSEKSGTGETSEKRGKGRGKRGF